MADQIETLEDRISKGINAFRQAKNPKIAPLAREFRVPYQLLRARIHGRGSKTNATSAKKTLNPI